MKRQFEAKVLITVETDDAFFMPELRETAHDAVTLDLDIEDSANILPSGGGITAVTIDWDTLMPTVKRRRRKA